MKKISLLLFPVLTLLILSGSAIGNDLEGEISLGYTLEDTEGNQSVEQFSHNEYEGFGFSLNDFLWKFGEDYRVNADLSNITLNNRNLRMGFQKGSLCRIDLFNNQFRRIYGSDGEYFTRRHNTGGNFWFSGHKNIRLYGGVNSWGKTGNQISIFDEWDDNAVVSPEEIDNSQFAYHFGMTFRQKGRMLQAEFRGADFSDNLDASRDQKRQQLTFWGFVPVPDYEWIRLLGGYRHFETEYDSTGFKISSNTGWGGFKVNLPINLSFTYYGMLNRTQSDSDLVAVDNMSHALYASYVFPRKAGVTVGYQFDTVDDIDDEIEANTFYFSAWYKPLDKLDIRGEFGTRSEEVFTGDRVRGDQDEIKHRMAVRYRFNDSDYLRGKTTMRNRENDKIGTEIDFWRLSFDGYKKMNSFAGISAGYNYTKGEYTGRNASTFEFIDHMVYGDLYLVDPLKGFYHDIPMEEAGMILKFGGMYYKSERDLDVERITLRFGLKLKLARDYFLEADYDVQNFDDLTVDDRYYTANIVTISINKKFTY